MPAPVYLVTSDDDHLLARAVEDLIGEIRSVVPGLEVEHAEVAQLEHLPELRTASLFGGDRCVVLRGAEGLSGDLAKAVAEVIAAPPDGVTLVLAARGTGRIQAVAKAAAAAGERRDVKKPREFQAREWEVLVRQEFDRLDRQVDAGAVRAILEHAGLEPSVIASKCAQVAAATPVGQRIGTGEVEQVVVGHGNRGSFAIADAVIARDPQAALVALRGALESAEAPLAILGAITYKFRQLLQVRGGVPADDLVPRKVSRGQYGHLDRAARSFGPGELAWCHDRIARADLDLKSSELPDTLVIELAVIDLATPRAVGRPWNPLAS